jgi:hypothetical protein
VLSGKPLTLVKFTLIIESGDIIEFTTIASMLPSDNGISLMHETNNRIVVSI